MACVCFLLSLLVTFFIYSESIFSANLDPTYFRKSIEIDDKSMPRTIIIGTYIALAFPLTLVKQLRQTWEMPSEHQSVVVYTSRFVRVILA